MHQSHFLLSAAARSLSVREIFGLSDERAFELLREVRWGREGEPVCPECGTVDAHWLLPSRRQWRCRACAHTFSVTSGTIFAHHKLPLQVYLGALAIYTNAVKGLSVRIPRKATTQSTRRRPLSPREDDRAFRAKATGCRSEATRA